MLVLSKPSIFETKQIEITVAESYESKEMWKKTSTGSKRSPNSHFHGKHLSRLKGFSPKI